MIFFRLFRKILVCSAVFAVVNFVAQFSSVKTAAQEQINKNITQNKSGDANQIVPAVYRPTPKYKGFTRSSRYLTMRDGVRIAIDLYLPKDLAADEKVPTILCQTLYWRSVELQPAAALLFDNQINKPGNRIGEVGQFFPLHGYAWIDVDVRGTGASFGSRAWDLAPDETADGAEIVDWIIKQPWSNGNVGATGLSYSGETAERLLINQHPAVKAVAPRFSNFDLYADVALPGGIPNFSFFKSWGKITGDLNRNVLPEIAAQFKDVVIGVRPVDEDKQRLLLRAAVKEHRNNYDIADSLSRVVFRDDFPISEKQAATPKAKADLERSFAAMQKRFGKNFLAKGLDIASTHSYFDEIESSQTAVYGYSGWFDGGFANSAIKRFNRSKNLKRKLILGPWEHGGFHNISPYDKGDSKFDGVGELLKFFDFYLKGNNPGFKNEKPVHYFTMGEEKWKSADTFPVPAAAQVFYFAANQSLSAEKPKETAASDSYSVDLTAGTGTETRWDSLTKGPLFNPYSDRAEQDKKLFIYDSAPLTADTEVTGHPLVKLFVSSTANDGAFFVYLEDVDENGKVSYVTEGMLRALHRKTLPENSLSKNTIPERSFLRKDAAPLIPGKITELAFDLLPTSYQFKKNHRIRIAIAGADKDHFAPISDTAPRLNFHRSKTYASQIVLPIVANRTK